MQVQTAGSVTCGCLPLDSSALCVVWGFELSDQPHFRFNGRQHSSLLQKHLSVEKKGDRMIDERDQKPIVGLRMSEESICA